MKRLDLTHQNIKTKNMKRKMLGLLLGISCILLPLNARKAVRLPSHLQGYWQNLPENDRDWPGPVIMPDYVNLYARIYYIDSIAGADAAHTTLFLRTDDNDRSELRIDRLAPDSISYLFTGSDTPKTAVRRPYHQMMPGISVRELPAWLFTRWKVDNSETEECEFYDTDHVRFQGAEWRIAGVRSVSGLADAYEILLKKNTRCHLLYLRPVTPSTLRCSSGVHTYTLVAVQPSADPALSRLAGAWTDADPAVNAWTYGFFEKFAVYRNECWSYESLDVKKNKGTVVLKKGDERLKLKLAFDSHSDSVCVVTPEKGKKRTYIRYTVLPDYASADTSSFADSGYRGDSVTLTGYFRGVGPGKPFEIAIDNFLTDREEKFYADFDSLGRFRITLPVLNTSETYIDWGRARLHNVLEPGEHIFLYHDFSTGETRYMGANARIHQELDQYFHSPEYRGEPDLLSYDAPGTSGEFLRRQQQITGQKAAWLEKYLSTHPGLSEKFKRFRKEGLQMELAYSLMQRRFRLDRRNKERFDAAYMAVADSLFARLPRPYTLLRDVSTFVRDYLDYYNDLKNSPVTMSIPLIDGLRQLNAEGRYPLTPAQQADLDTCEEGVNLSIYLTYYEGKDSAAVAEGTRSYLPATERLKPVLEDSVLVKYLEEEWPAVSAGAYMRKRLKKELVAADSLQIDPVLRELIVTQLFFKDFEHDRRLLPEAQMDFFRQQVHNPYLLQQVEAMQAYYRELDRQDIQYVESLKKTEHLAESKDADELFTELTEAYRGKVIYIDFWGTWCGPCKEQLGYAGAVKEALKGKDVIFMYFANRSPEDSWKNVIKQYHLTGPNVVHYNLPDEQQQLLERRFSIAGFPTFILIDKKGRVVNMNAPRPQQKDALVKAIETLLEKK